MKIWVIIAGLATLGLGTSPGMAQEMGNPFNALKGMMDKLQSQRSSPAPTMTAAQAMAALGGKWESDKAACYKPSDSFVFARDGSWSGYEWSCEVPDSAYNARGFAGNLTCSSQGEEYQSKLRVELAQDGQSANVSRIDDGVSETIYKCPKETEEIMF